MTSQIFKRMTKNSKKYDIFKQSPSTWMEGDILHLNEHNSYKQTPTSVFLVS